MARSLKRAVAAISLFLLFTMVANANLSTEANPAVEERSNLIEAGATFLDAVDLRVENGLGRLIVDRGAGRAYIVELDLKTFLKQLERGRNAEIALLALGLWIIAPLLWQSSRAKIGGAQSFGSARPKSGPSPAQSSPYRRMRGLTFLQIATVVRRAGALPKRAVAQSVLIAGGNFKIRRYMPRHAGGGKRRATIIIAIGPRRA